MWLALLKNPITKLVAEKTIGAVTHKLKKNEIIKERELNDAKNVDLQSLKSGDNSLKDEWLVIVFSLIFLAQTSALTISIVELHRSYRCRMT